VEKSSLPKLLKLYLDYHLGSPLHVTDVSINELGSGLPIRIVQEIIKWVKRITGYGTQGSGM